MYICAIALLFNLHTQLLLMESISNQWRFKSIKKKTLSIPTGLSKQYNTKKTTTRNISFKTYNSKTYTILKKNNIHLKIPFKIPIAVGLKVFLHVVFLHAILVSPQLLNQPNLQSLKVCFYLYRKRTKIQYEKWTSRHQNVLFNIKTPQFPQ